MLNASKASSQALQLSVSEGTFGDFQYKINDEGNGIVITHYLGNAASIDVPEQINQLPVVTIGASAFEGNTTLTSINLPDTVQVIGERAFANCTNLSEMN